MSDPTRLSDEQVDPTRLRLSCRNYDNSNPPPRFCGKCAVCLAADELLALRAFLTGGPCETCEGRGTIDTSIHARHVTIRQADRCPNPDCVNGHQPGLIEKLEALRDDVGCMGEHADDVAEPLDALKAIISEARRMVEP